VVVRQQLGLRMGNNAMTRIKQKHLQKIFLVLSRNMHYKYNMQNMQNKMQENMQNNLNMQNHIQNTTNNMSNICPFVAIDPSD
jgi:hypothetical protein